MEMESWFAVVNVQLEDNGSGMFEIRWTFCFEIKSRCLLENREKKTNSNKKNCECSYSTA